MPFTLMEATLGGLLHDIGKFMQRAHRSVQELPESSRCMEDVLCPTIDGRRTHKHVLWTNAFFDWMESEGLGFPKGVNRDTVRVFANSHHLPDSPRDAAIGWLSAKADRYSSGMDRKPRQEALDTGDAHGWDAFRKTPQRCIFDLVDLGLGSPRGHRYRLDLLDPATEALMPAEGVGEDTAMPEAYGRLWQLFCDDFATLCRGDRPSRLFEEGLLGLLERYAWAIPSSTMDIPDISLYDHSRTVAAIAACSHRFHETEGSLSSLEAVKDDGQAKFRLLSGDLSGIQSTLFTLESQGVRGVAKILRARSFLLGAVTEAAALRVLDALDLPHSCLLQQAGGRFLVLLANVPAVESALNGLQRVFDRWLVERYAGALALNLALGEPFPGADFRSERFADVVRRLHIGIEGAKHRPLYTIPQGVLVRDYQHGACKACGVRPIADVPEGHCLACADEVRLGRLLPKARLLGWSPVRLPGAELQVEVMGLWLSLRDDSPPHADRSQYLSMRSVEPRDESSEWPKRLLANYVPTFRDSAEPTDPVYRGIVEEGEGFAAGDVKTFSHIAAHAREPFEGGYVSKPFLAVLKADMDRLGLIFGCGLRAGGEDRFTLSRFVQLSRMTDLFFTGKLQELLRARFPNAYTVYAGGDDLLLIGPWRQMFKLACELNELFRAYSGHNPNITLSAGLELVHANMPVNRAVESADARLDAAKAEGKDRFCALSETPLPWSAFPGLLDDAEWINAQMRDGQQPISTSFVYRLLALADDAEAANRDPARAGWRAKLGYAIRRVVHKDRQFEWLTRLRMDDPKGGAEALHRWRLPISIAIFRNRD